MRGYRKTGSRSSEKPVFTIPTIASNCAPVTKTKSCMVKTERLRKVKRFKFGSGPLLYPSWIILDAPIRYPQGGIEIWQNMLTVVARQERS